MFGDVGQGLCLLIGGALLYKFRKMRLAGIISWLWLLLYHIRRAVRQCVRI